MNLYLAVLAKSSKGKYWELAVVAQNVVNAAFMEICARAAMSAREKYSMHQRANHALRKEAERLWAPSHRGDGGSSVKTKKLRNCGKCEEVPCKIWHGTKDPGFSDEEFEKNIAERVHNLKS